MRTRKNNWLAQQRQKAQLHVHQQKQLQRQRMRSYREVGLLKMQAKLESRKVVTARKKALRLLEEITRDIGRIRHVSSGTLVSELASLTEKALALDRPIV